MFSRTSLRSWERGLGAPGGAPPPFPARIPKGKGWNADSVSMSWLICKESQTCGWDIGWCSVKWKVCSEVITKERLQERADKGKGPGPQELLTMGWGLCSGMRLGCLVPSLSLPTQPMDMAIGVCSVSPGISPRGRVRCEENAGQLWKQGSSSEVFLSGCSGDFLHHHLPVLAVPSTAGKPLARAWVLCIHTPSL